MDARSIAARFAAGGIGNGSMRRHTRNGIGRDEPMSKRRGRGEGSIVQRGDGRWMARVQIDRSEDGRRQRNTVYGDSVRRRAETQRLVGPVLRRRAADDETPTLKAWLNDWFKTHQDEWRASTRRVYRTAIDFWLAPALGPVRLDAVEAVGGPEVDQRQVQGRRAPDGADVARRVALGPPVGHDTAAGDVQRGRS